MPRGWRVIKGGKDGEGNGKGEGSGEETQEISSTTNYNPYPETRLVKPPSVDERYWNNMTYTEQLAAVETWDDFLRNNS